MMGNKGLVDVRFYTKDKDGNDVEVGQIREVSLNQEAIEVNSLPWYRTQKHYEITPVYNKRGISADIKVLPAGEVWVLSRRMERKALALKYVKHSKKKQKLSKQLENLKLVYGICNLHEVGLKEAVEILRGQK